MSTTNADQAKTMERINTQELKEQKSTHESYNIQTESFLRESVREKNSDLGSVQEKSAAMLIKNKGIAISMNTWRTKKPPMGRNVTRNYNLD